MCSDYAWTSTKPCSPDFPIIAAPAWHAHLVADCLNQASATCDACEGGYDLNSNVCTLRADLPTTFFPTTGDNLGVAIGEWCGDQEAAYSNYGHISSWDVSAITDFQGRFSQANIGWQGCTAFNEDISSWNIVSATSLKSMFSHQKSFNVDISAWNTALVETMENLFYYAEAFNQDLSSWSTHKVTNFEWTFSSAIIFNGDVSSWNTASATSMWVMFNSATLFNRDISSWNTQNVVRMGAMFQAATAFNQDLSSWSTANVCKGDMCGCYGSCDMFGECYVQTATLCNMLTYPEKAPPMCSDYYVLDYAWTSTKHCL